MGSISPPPGQFRQPTQPQRPTASASPPSRRGGCLTTFLILIVIANASAIAVYSSPSIQATQALSSVPRATRQLLSLLNVLNIGFAIALFRWRKWGFYGIAATTIIGLLINLSADVPKGIVVTGLMGPIVLWLLLRPHWNDMT